MSKKVKPTSPRYDDVFFEGLRFMDWIEICEDKPVCRYFLIDGGCTEIHFGCPCDKYEARYNL